MTKSNLYTRTGDSGTTSLVGGERVAKDCARLEAYGQLDTFSSQLGRILSAPDCNEEVRGQLRIIQNKLFNIGAYLATEPQPGTKPEVYGLTQKDLNTLEGWIDALDEQTPKIRAFVLPGGCPLCADAHVARTECRTAERRITTLASESYVDPLLVQYINRLSDYLFILARYFNFISGVDEVVWDKDA